MTPRNLSTIVLVGTLLNLSIPRWVNAEVVDITIDDRSPYHVYPLGKSFDVRVKVSYTGRSSVFGQWVDYRGHALAQPVPLLPQQFVTFHSPGSSTGYYGLVIQADSSELVLPDRRAGETREYGFAILPPKTIKQRLFKAISPFGMVHADINDPYSPVWVKTTGWDTGQQWWRSEMDKRRATKTIELPLIAEQEWASDDTRPVSEQFLDKLKTKIARYFRADPHVLYWEAGIEEVLGEHYTERYYWPNLQAKIKVFRQAADGVNVNIKFIYQTVGTQVEEDGITTFLKSGAAQFFDTLSIHPYAWPDFPAPETWMTALLKDTRATMQKFKRTMPIWFTEVGATHHGNPGGFFGYPENGNKVTGLSREDAVTYLVKMHILALSSAVEKIFWYNYQDRDSRREHAEDHFGLRDYWGYPKPVYVAYAQLQSALADKVADTHQLISNHVHVHRFTGVSEDVLVVWQYPVMAQTEVLLTSLKPGLIKQDIVRAESALGGSVELSPQGIRVSAEPVYIFIKK